MTALAYHTPQATVAELLRRARRPFCRRKRVAYRVRRDHNAAIAECERNRVMALWGFAAFIGGVEL